MAELTLTGSGHVPPSRTRNCLVLNVPSQMPGRSGSGAGSKQPWVQRGRWAGSQEGTKGSSSPALSGTSDMAALSQTLDFPLPGQVLGPPRLLSEMGWGGLINGHGACTRLGFTHRAHFHRKRARAELICHMALPASSWEEGRAASPRFHLRNFLLLSEKIKGKKQQRGHLLAPLLPRWKGQTLRV